MYEIACFGSDTYSMHALMLINSGEFDRSHVENGVRMQKLWPVKVSRQKLPKTARQRGREKFQYNLFVFN
jgi:hypothetical protein